MSAWSQSVGGHKTCPSSRKTSFIYWYYVVLFTRLFYGRTVNSSVAYYSSRTCVTILFRNIKMSVL